MISDQELEPNFNNNEKIIKSNISVNPETSRLSLDEFAKSFYLESKTPQ